MKSTHWATDISRTLDFVVDQFSKILFLTLPVALFSTLCTLHEISNLLMHANRNTTDMRICLETD